MAKLYDHQELDRKWQARWREDDTYRTERDPRKEKAYVLDMFPYPSGEGLHVGHPKGYIATDVYSRYQRMQGKEVLHPMGWDAFGLPAENYALKNKVHPRAAVEKNIARYKQQLEKIGFDYDWSREINTTDPDYYRWTQWIFLKLYENGLASRSEEPINWCPSCMTGLANEDIEQGVCERCDTPVIKKTLPQWVLKITDYADRLLKDLDQLPKWPDHIKESQRNWIGRSEGAEIDFKAGDETITVFTTRPDTIYGATYLVLAPEHPLLAQFLAAVSNTQKVQEYIEAAATKTEIERTAEGGEKTGVLLEGVTATNPATREKIPVYVADYVLGHYGTGAIMAVPAHDERDYAFAKKYDLPIHRVIDPVTGTKQEQPVEKGKIVAIVEHDGKVLTINWKPGLGGRLTIGGTAQEGEDPAVTAMREIAEETGYTDLDLIETAEEQVHHEYFAHSKGIACVAHTTLLHFRLKSDARQEPALEEDEKDKFQIEWLPFDDALREIKDPLHTYALSRFLTPGAYAGTGLLRDSGAFTGRDSEEAKWEMAEAAGGKRVVRYRLRDWVFSRQRYWGEPIPILYCDTDGIVPVPYEDLPVRLPDVEHYEPTGTGESPLAAIPEWVNTTCPTCGGPAKRETNTMPQWAGSSWYYLRYMDPKNDAALVSSEDERYWAPVDLYVGGAEHATRHLIYARFWHKFLYDIGVVSTVEPFEELHSVGLIIAEDNRKMSKRFGNVVNPDDVVAEYGADAFRVYEMFMGPFEHSIAWNTKGLVGARRFLDRVFRVAEKVELGHIPDLDRVIHATIKKVSEDIPAFRFNTAVSAMMICLNAIEDAGKVGKDQWVLFLRLLAPFAPHLTEELWERLGGTGSIHHAEWPEFDASLLVRDTIVIGVQVAGKRRGEVELSPDASEEEVVAAALAIPKVKEALPAGKPSKVVYVPGRILNLVP